MYLRVLFILIFCAISEAKSLKYRYYLDPSRAEEVLFSIALRSRVSEEEWLKVIGGKKLETYHVKVGDNLWSISHRQLGTSWFWPKLWQMNPILSNPHEIEIGQVLTYYQEGRAIASEPAPIRIPVVKLYPGNLGFANDLDKDAIVNIDIKNRFRINFLVMDDEEILGELKGSYTEKRSFGELDAIYASFGSIDNVKEGDRFSIVRESTEVRDQLLREKRYFGKIMRVMGEIRVVEKGIDLTKVEITGMVNPMQRGDKIVKSLEAIRWSQIFNPPEDLSGVILMGEEPEHRWIREGGLVFIDKGSQDGFKEGYLFRVFRNKDSLTQQKEGVDPDYKGQVHIIYVSKHCSIGYVRSSKTVIELGDVLVPSQLFSDPSKPIKEEPRTVELR